MTAKQIKVLLIEDNPEDTRLIREMLSEVSDTALDMEYADMLSTGLECLAAGVFDLILLDLGLPDSSGLDTFTRVHAQALEVPIVILTGLDDVTVAIKAVREGAQDYLSKNQLDSNSLVRSMQYAIERKRTEATLRESEKRFKDVSFSMADWIWEVDENGLYTYCSEKVQKVLGYSKNEIIGKTPFDLMPPEEAEKIAQIFKEIFEKKKQIRDLENWNFSKDGKRICLLTNGVPFFDDQGILKGYRGFNRDITARKLSEDCVRIHAMQQDEAAKFGKLAMSDISIDELMDEAVILISRVLDTKYSKVLEHLPNEKKLFLRAGVGWKKGWVGRLIMPDGIQSQGGYSLLCDSPVISEDIFREKRFSPPPLLTEHDVASGLTVVIPGKERPYGVLGVHTDRKRRFSSDDANFIQTIANVLADAIELKREKEKLHESEKRFEDVAENALEWVWEVDTNGKYTYTSPVTEKILGYKPEEILKKHFYDLFHPEVREELKKAAFDSFAKKQLLHDFINLNVHKDGKAIWLSTSGVPILDEKGNLLGYRGVDTDITERKRAEEELKQTVADLERSNAELEQFAYVASHDLQEPLRTVSSYVQLLARRYKGKLDADADDFIAYVVDGANRMQMLINDLLTYSRVGTHGKLFEPTDCETVLEQTLANLQLVIEDSVAKITHGALPTVMADDSQLVQLFQNLIENAIKFRSKEPPLDFSPLAHFSDFLKN